MPIVLGRKPGGSGGGGAPSGPAGGSLTGTYPNPTIGAGAVDASMVAADVATQAELNAVAALIGQEVIQTVTRATDGFIDFTAIPATFAHLRIVAYLRGAQAAATEGGRIRVGNGSLDTGNNYDYVWGGTLNVSAEAGAESGVSYIRFGTIVGNSGTADKYAAVDILIPNYAGGDIKSMVTSMYSANSNAVGTQREAHGGGTWRNTAAITDIRLWTDNGTGNLFAGSTATLYGLR